MAQKPMLRAEVGMRVVRNDSGGREALAKFLKKNAKSEVVVFCTPQNNKRKAREQRSS